jgi:hypothetical protein
MTRKKQKLNPDTGGGAGGGGGGEGEEGEEGEEEGGESICYPQWFHHEQKNEYWYYCENSNAYFLYTVPLAAASPGPGSAEESKPTEQALTQWPLWCPHEDQSFYWCFCEETKDYTLYPVWYYDEKRSVYWYFSGLHNACLMYDENAQHGEERADDRDREGKTSCRV